ncbi:prepilin peptidase [Amycolatopsis kentuckyensis]|uniref:prepilin peptidase n=1 Tax=Amycolatopsis kentuckyensis TaxID=218823 RepID=UPI0035657BEC
MPLPILLMAAAAATAPVTASALDRARAPIPRRPAAVLTTLATAAATVRWASGAWPTWWLPVPVVLAVVAVPLVLADLRHLRLPDVLTLPAYPLFGAAIGAAALGGGGPSLAARAVFGALLFGGAHALVARLAPGSLGAGDVKLSGSLGMVLGAAGWPTLALAAVLAALFSLALATATSAHQRRATARALRATALHPAAADPRPAPTPHSARLSVDLHPAGPAPPATGPRPAPNPHPADPTPPEPASHQATPPPPAPARNPTPTSRPAPTPPPTAPFSGPRVPHGPALLAATWLCALFPGAP